MKNYIFYSAIFLIAALSKSNAQGPESSSKPGVSDKPAEVFKARQRNWCQSTCPLQNLSEHPNQVEKYYETCHIFFTELASVRACFSKVSKALSTLTDHLDQEAEIRVSITHDPRAQEVEIKKKSRALSQWDNSIKKIHALQKKFEQKIQKELRKQPEKSSSRLTATPVFAKHFTQTAVLPKGKPFAPHKRSRLPWES